MKRTDTSEWPCTIARSADMLGDHWNLLLIRQACLGTRRFDDFQAALGIGRNILTQRLTRLVDEGLLTRVEYQQNPRATSTGSPTRAATPTRSSRPWPLGRPLAHRAGRHAARLHHTMRARHARLVVCSECATTRRSPRSAPSRRLHQGRSA